MKLNTKLGIARKAKPDSALQDMQDQMQALVSEIRNLKAPADVQKKPLAFALEIQRDRAGSIELVRARDAATGKDFYTFSVSRDRSGGVTSIAALPQ